MKAAELRSIRRLRLGLTQQQLAERLEVHRNSISDYERGKAKIPKLVEIAVRCLAEHERRP